MVWYLHVLLEGAKAIVKALSKAPKTQFFAEVANLAEPKEAAPQASPIVATACPSHSATAENEKSATEQLSTEPDLPAYTAQQEKDLASTSAVS